MDNETISSLAVMALAGSAIAVLLLWTTPAEPGVCLSKSEARQLWPHRHIYWYSKDHCWSNRRGPPRGLKLDPIIEPTPKRAKEVMPDEPKHDTNKKEPLPAMGEADECCWPLLDYDASGNLIEPPEPFTRRWYEFPTVFVFFRLVEPTFYSGQYRSLAVGMP